MNKSRVISVVLILLGVLLAIFAGSLKDQKQVVLIGGIVFMMAGIFRISQNIPSKEDNDETFIQTEDED